MLPRTVLRFALIAGGFYLAYALLVFLMQRDILFAGRRRGAKPPQPELTAGVERVWLTLPEGRVEALYMPPPVGMPRPAPSLLFAHGNAELIEQWPDQLAGMQALGLGLLLVEYPGYGRSDGSPSEHSVRAAMLAGYDFLAARSELDPSRIVGFGRSLGGGAICTLVGQRPLAALLLTSTFTGVRSFAGGMFVPGFLARDPFDSLDAVRRFDGPILIAHGTRDRVVPFAHGEQLARAAKRARLLRYDADHNDCPPDWRAFAEEFRVFLRAHGLLSEP
ncbi:MAG TPA: hypothetical protein VK509_24430 [Polyangiales bacterium]|nr:hypothetical protein [Polyangiales bacterium]